MFRTLITLALASAFIPACGQKATYIETGGTESIVSVGEVDIQDIMKASSGMLESLLATGVLKEAPHQPARLVLDHVVNDTSSVFDTGDLLSRMRAQLANSGQAEFETAYGANAESQVAQDELKRKAFLEGKTADDVFQPDFALTGKITQIKRSAGRTKQTTYTFRLTLTRMFGTGGEAWSEVVDMTKQGTKSSVGF
jgi:PBP1b-binding outer membrane lipoprotein LpoB